MIKTFAKGRIGRRLVFATIIFSSFITLLTTSYQLYFDYKKDIAAIDGYFGLIKDSYIESLTTSVWMYDEKQISSQLDGLIKMPDMEYLEIRASDDHFWSSGSLKSKHKITRHFSLIFEHRNKEFEIGMLSATASLDKVYDRLIGKALSILISNAVRAFFVSCFILLIFHLLVTRRLIRLSENVENIDLKKYPIEIELKESKRKNSIDEIDEVVYALGKTQQKLFESYEELKQSQDELFQIFTMSIDLICIANINTSTFVKVNPAFIATLGFSEEELLSKSFLEFIHPDDVQSTQRAVDEDLKAGKTVLNFENRYICKDGSYRWFRWVSQPQPEKGLTYAIAHDITELKQSVNKLEESHQRFLTVLDAIDAHIYVADMVTYEILFMNTKMQKDFDGDFTGNICWRSFRGENGQCPHCTNSRLVNSNGEPDDILTWQGKNPLTGKWYINHDRAIKWVDGRIVRLQIAMDITEHKKTEEELRQAHKMEAVGTLAGGIAHDFNNILGIIVGNIELALEDIPEWNPARPNLDEVKTASLRARNVVQQLLSFSRKSEQQRTPLKLALVIEESIKLLRASIPSNIDIKTDIQDAQSFIKADSTQIQQVLINLCTNAAHAMEENGGVLRLSLKQKEIDEPIESLNNKILAGTYMHLMIGDNGKGIPPEIMDKIFDPYFTTKDVGKGSGLGLSIVHGIVANHDGGILIQSEPEKGTVIEILFPVDQSEYIAKQETKAELPKGNERILFIDDEESIVKVASQMLTRLGYSVDSKINPLDALSHFKSAPDSFDLLISDMTMPNLTGDQLAIEIKAVRSDIPIIICTGFSERMDEQKADNLEISGILMKPIVRSEMAKMVRKVLDESKN